MESPGLLPDRVVPVSTEMDRIGNTIGKGTNADGNPGIGSSIKGADIGGKLF